MNALATLKNRWCGVLFFQIQRYNSRVLNSSTVNVRDTWYCGFGCVRNKFANSFRYLKKMEVF